MTSTRPPRDGHAFTRLALAATAAAVLPLAARAAGPTTTPVDRNPITGSTVTAPAAAPATRPADNLQYTSWARFKAGSTATLVGEATTPMGKVHLEVVQTLAAVTADAVTIQITGTITQGGRAHALPASTQTIAAKQDAEEAKQTGTEDVTVAGKTYHCRVYEQATEHGQPLPGGATAKMDVSDEVPGGTVKAQQPGPAGSTVNLELKSVEVK